MKTRLTETLELLANSNESRRALAERADVGYWWLVRFERGAIGNPGIKHVENLYFALLERQAA